jgi:lysophospholipase L1-like esterase
MALCDDHSQLKTLIQSLKKSNNPAARPTSRSEKWIKVTNKKNRHLQKSDFDVVLIGDSITKGWDKYKTKLNIAFGKKRVLNLGFSADKIENMIWRLQHYDLSKINPIVTVIMAGTNNTNGDEYSNEEILDGVKNLVALTRAKLPTTNIILMGILPRGSQEQRNAIQNGLSEAPMNPQWSRIVDINTGLKSFAKQTELHYLNINEYFLNAGKELVTTSMPDLLHPNEQGYDLWANGMLPFISNIEKKISNKGEQLAIKDKEYFEAQSKISWKQTFCDSFTDDWAKQWTLDGEVGTVTVSDKGTLLTSGPEFRNNAHHMVLWTKDEFKGDVKIEYEFTRMDQESRCVNILYIQATGSGKAPFDKDISKWANLRKDPHMHMYFDYMNTYHISYAAFPNPNNVKDDYIRARRYMPHQNGLDGTDIPPDYFMNGFFETGVTHKICVIKKNKDLCMKISNASKTKYFHWPNKDLPPITEGRIGLRLMFCRSSQFKDFKVSVPN